jgi:hypothetical protein
LDDSTSTWTDNDNCCTISDRHQLTNKNSSPNFKETASHSAVLHHIMTIVALSCRDPGVYSHSIVFFCSYRPIRRCHPKQHSLLSGVETSKTHHCSNIRVHVLRFISPA